VSIDESQLVPLAQKGDVASLERLLEDHYDYIFSICRKVIGNTEDANEATQEALISIVKNINSFKFSSKFSTWVYRIATNAALDEIRKKSRRPTTEFNEETVTTERKSSLEDEVIDRIDVTTALQALPEEFRIVLVLRDQLGNSYDDIGELLGVPAGTVKSRIARARQKIKEELLGNKIHSQGVKEVNDG
jgi:RNA polymerase sigma-70 factor (ECF subfamily)